MNRTIRASIVFYSNPDQDPFLSDEPLSDEEALEYAKECFYDDIVSFMRENELMDIIDVEIVNND